MYNSQFAIIFIIILYIIPFLIFVNLSIDKLIYFYTTYTLIHFYTFYISYLQYFFSFHVYNGLANLNRSSTKFNSPNKNRNSIKILPCCLG